MPDFTFERACGSHLVAGVDEAGRGPWAGPVVAAAAVLWNGAEPQYLPRTINDSKKLTAACREQLYQEITGAFDVGVGIVDVVAIDTINILQATLLAMRQAVANLSSAPAMVLVDGLHIPQLPCGAQAIIKGDERSISIAAASIVAKVTRDRIMRQLHREFPHYGWEKNAGYGTKAHQQALLAHGVSPHHRRSFRPVRELLASEQGARKAALSVSEAHPPICEPATVARERNTPGEQGERKAAMEAHHG